MLWIATLLGRQQIQTMMNLIQEFNGTNWEAKVLWLDYIEGFTKKMGFNPLEIGMSKLKGYRSP